MIKEFIHKVLAGENLTQDEASQAMDLIMTGEATPAQIAGLIIALRQKGETAEEVAGFVISMRAHSVKIALNNPSAVDGCGTGGDGSNSFNISTAASLVAAAAGVTVAKHGNRSISSKCGSADLLEASGGSIDPGPETVTRCINDVGFGFMFAPRFHPAMKHAAGPRKELGVRTIFNILGPMTNPAGVKRQVIGVFARELIDLKAEVLERTGSSHVLLAHARDGLDEFSITAPTDYVELKNGKRKVQTITPEQVGIDSYTGDVLKGGDAQVNIRILRDLLTGEKTPYRDAVLFNAGAMIYVSGAVVSIAEGVRNGAEAIDSGAAEEKMAEWVKISNS